MLMLTFAAVLQIFWSLPPVTISVFVAVPQECKEYCERQRPQHITNEKSFTVDCNSIKDKDEMIQCKAMCEKDKCPQQAVCQSRGKILQCPARNDTRVDLSSEEVGWEVVLLYVGFGVGFLLCAVLIGLCIYDHIQYSRSLRRRQVSDEELEQYRIRCIPEHHHNTSPTTKSTKAKA